MVVGSQLRKDVAITLWKLSSHQSLALKGGVGCPDLFEWLRLRPVEPTMRFVGGANLAAGEVVIHLVRIELAPADVFSFG